MRALSSHQERALRNRREIMAARLGRRELIKMGLLTAAGTLVAKDGLHADALPASPPTRPFVVPLPIPPVKQKLANGAADLTPRPNGHVFPDPRSAPQQLVNRLPPVEFYEIHETAFLHSFHPDLDRLGGPSTVWGFDGLSPGPTFHATYGKPILVRNVNDLPPFDNAGFGMPQTSTHLHNGHTASESDGYPGDFYGPNGVFKDFHYGNFAAGAVGGGDDGRERMATLWYHDHRIDFTAQNVYKGLAGFYLLFDEQDSNDEADPNPRAFHLPSGPFDVPMVFVDRAFDAHGQLAFDLFNFDGFLGDKFTVNGVVQPFFAVKRRKYRLRLLNASVSRFYEFFLSDGRPFFQVSSDGNLFFQFNGTERGLGSIRRQSVRIAPAERVDVIVDFSTARAGDQIFLQNRLVQNDGRGPTDKLVAPGMPVLRFDVGDAAPDPSVLPPPVTAFDPPDVASAVKTRLFEFNRDNGAWAVNGNFFDLDRVDAAPLVDSAEIWILKNGGGGWNHPIHIHFEEFRILSRNGRKPPLFEQGRKDVANLGPGEEVRVLMKFRDFAGTTGFNNQYVMHCHNLVHEDHAMMIRFDVAAAKA